MQDALFNSPSIADKAVQGYSGLINDAMSMFDGSSNRRSDIGSHDEMLQFVPMSSETSYAIQDVPEQDDRIHDTERMDDTRDTQISDRMGKPAIESIQQGQKNPLDKRRVEIDSSESDGAKNVKENVLPLENTEHNKNEVIKNDVAIEMVPEKIIENQKDQSLNVIVSLIKRKIDEEDNQPKDVQQNFEENHAKTKFPNRKMSEKKSDNQMSSDSQSNDEIILDDIDELEAPKEDIIEYGTQTQKEESDIKSTHKSISSSKSRHSFNRHSLSNTKYILPKHNRSNKKKNSNKKYGKYNTLPKNFGYKKWGLRLPPKMLPVAKKPRKPRKSEIALTKKASQERYKTFLKRKFKLESGRKDRAKMEPIPEKEVKTMQKNVGNPTSPTNFDAISEGHEIKESDSVKNGNKEALEPLPVPKKLIMSGKNESIMNHSNYNHLVQLLFHLTHHQYQMLGDYS